MFCIAQAPIVELFVNSQAALAQMKKLREENKKLRGPKMASFLEEAAVVFDYSYALLAAHSNATGKPAKQFVDRASKAAITGTE